MFQCAYTYSTTWISLLCLMSANSMEILDGKISLVVKFKSDGLAKQCVATLGGSNPVRYENTKVRW